MLASYFADSTVECLAAPAVEEDTVDCATAVDKAEKKKKKKERKLARRLAAEAEAQATAEAIALNAVSPKKSAVETAPSSPGDSHKVPDSSVAASSVTTETKSDQDAPREPRVGRVGRTALKFESAIELESPTTNDPIAEPIVPVEPAPVAEFKKDTSVMTAPQSPPAEAAKQEEPAELGFVNMPLRDEVIQAVVKSGYTLSLIHI